MLNKIFFGSYGHYQVYEITKYTEEGIIVTLIFSDRIRSYFIT